jgi:hypothetical protein
MPRFRLPETNQRREDGYLLASSAILILVVIAMLGSFAFVMTRDSHFKGNYATGERLAQLAMLSHFYAQEQFYASGTNLDLEGDLYGGGYLVLPDNFAFAPVANTDFSVEVIGRTKAPVNNSTIDTVKAASAYLHLRIRPLNNKNRAPSDVVALEAGANHRGLARIGYYKTGIAAGDTCDGVGNNTAVRWGPEDDACLNDAQIAAMFSPDIKPGDIVIPAWETAVAQINKDAMTRYPQPQRPDISAMSAELHMGGHNIINSNAATVGRVAQPKDIVVTPDPTFPVPSTFQSMNVHGTTNFNGTGTATVAMQNGLILNTGTGAMTVAGPVNLTGNLQIANDLKKTGSDNLAVIILSPSTVNLQTIQQWNPPSSLPSDPSNPPVILIQPASGSTVTVGVSTLSGVNNLNVTSGTGRLAVAGVFDAVGGTMQNSGSGPLSLYAAQMLTVDNPANPVVIRNDADNLGWQVGSIVQNTTTGSLQVNSLIVNVACTSTNTPSACPNAITGGGTGGPFP